MKKILLLASVLTGPICVMAETLDFDRITHWAGEGPNRAALVVSFAPETGQADPGTPVWGFRWADGETPTGADMLRAIAGASSDLVVLTQFTGDMGNTVCGIGYAPDIKNLIGNLHYDFDGAGADSRNKFGFDSPNTGMGQTSAPGGDAVYMIADAISAAEEAHVIEHPLDAGTYGYPSYDYDWWTLDRAACSGPARCYWNAGWYDGYWSYWLGDADLGNFGYSGLGMSSVVLCDGDVHGWKYNDFAGGSSDEWSALNYSHSENGTTGIGAVETADAAPVWYRIDGTALAERPSHPGIYVVRRGMEVSKVIIR